MLIGNVLYCDYANKKTSLCEREVLVYSQKKIRGNKGVFVLLLF